MNGWHMDDECDIRDNADSYSTIQYNTIRQKSLTWTQKLSVVSLIQHTKLKHKNGRDHLVQYRFKMR